METKKSGRKKKGQELSGLPVISNEELDKILVLNTEDLENQLKSHNEHFAILMEYGSIPDLTQLSWKMYDRYKKGLLPKYFEDDEDDIRRFYSIKRQELILQLSTFLSIVVNHMLDPEKLANTSSKDLASSMQIALTMLHSLMGKEDKTIKHSVKHGLENMTEQDVETKLNQLKEKLTPLAGATDVEYEEIKEIKKETKEAIKEVKELKEEVNKTEIEF